MRTLLTTALLSAVFSSAALMAQARDTPATKHSAPAKTAHGTKMAAKKTAHHYRKVQGAGVDPTDNSNPKVFGDDVKTTTPKPKP